MELIYSAYSRTHVHLKREITCSVVCQKNKSLTKKLQELKDKLPHAACNQHRLLKKSKWNIYKANIQYWHNTPVAKTWSRRAPLIKKTQGHRTRLMPTCRSQLPTYIYNTHLLTAGQCHESWCCSDSTWSGRSTGGMLKRPLGVEWNQKQHVHLLIEKRSTGALQNKKAQRSSTRGSTRLGRQNPGMRYRNR